MRHQTLILRPLLISRDDYLVHLGKLRDWHPDAPGCGTGELECVRSLLAEIPEYLWMVEVSIPELFPANFRKLDELIIHPDLILWRNGGLECGCRMNP